MSKIKAYFTSKDWKWWLSNIGLVVIGLILIVPSWRLKFSTKMNELIMVHEPNVEIDRKEIPPINWPITDLNKNEDNVAQSEGKVIFINAWATWCGPCLAELPSMNELYIDYEDQVDFYFISTDQVDVLNKFNKKMNYSIPMYSSFTSSRGLESSSIPTTFVIDKKGKLVYTKKGAADWNSSSVRSLLDQLINED